jgi:serine/threonine protein kinase
MPLFGTLFRNTSSGSDPHTPLPSILSTRRVLIPSRDVYVHDEDQLGSGRLGSVTGGLWLGQPVAIKRLVTSAEEAQVPGTRARLEKEIADLIPHLNHPNLLPLYGIVEMSDGSIGLVFKKGKGGSLKNAIRKHRASGGLPLSDILHVAKGIASALTFLHNLETPIVYRQLRPGNVILSGDSNPMLDPEFGVIREILKIITSRMRLTAVMTSGGNKILDSAYLAPEVLSNDKASSVSSSCASDIYSLGMVILEMTTGQAPFNLLQSDLEVYRAVVVEHERPAIPANVPAPLASLIKRCIDQLPENRPTSRDVLDSLSRIEKELLANQLPSISATATFGTGGTTEGSKAESQFQNLFTPK